MSHMIGPYRVLTEIGDGGMAYVYVAQSASGGRVIVKIPKEDDPDTLRRLRTEAQLGLQLAHPSLVETLEVFEHEGKPALVVAYIDAASLKAVVKHQPLRTKQVAYVGAKMASALHAVHIAEDISGTPLGVIHRDVKTANILISRYGDPKLIDLGIAKSEASTEKTQAGFIVGTLPYIAPEVFEGKGYSTSSDFWALGCVLFECADGKRFFRGNQAVVMRELLTRKIPEDPRLNAIDAPLRSIIIRMLDRDPDRRLANGKEAARELGALAVDPESIRLGLGTLASELLDENASTSFYSLDGAQGNPSGDFPSLAGSSSPQQPTPFSFSEPPASAPPPGLSDNPFALSSSPFDSPAPASTNPSPSSDSPFSFAAPTGAPGGAAELFASSNSSAADPSLPSGTIQGAPIAEQATSAPDPFAPPPQTDGAPDPFASFDAVASPGPALDLEIDTPPPEPSPQPSSIETERPNRFGGPPPSTQANSLDLARKQAKPSVLSSTLPPPVFEEEKRSFSRSTLAFFGIITLLALALVYIVYSTVEKDKTIRPDIEDEF